MIITPSPQSASNHAARRVFGSWEPVDLGMVLDGDFTPVQPTLGVRDDGVFLLYAGKVHTVASEPAAGKTWLALLWVAEQLGLGHGVVYIDFEDDASAITGRLMALGVDRDVILDRFIYIRPTEALRAAEREEFINRVVEARISLVIIDGVTEAMTIAGKSLVDNADVAQFFNSLPKPIADAGPAVVLLDHEVKSAQDRGRFSLGAQHKLAAVDGAAYKMTSVEPFAIGRPGRSHLRLVKDRPGSLGRYTLGGEKELIAELTVHGHSPTRVEISLTASPGESERLGKEARLQEAILRAVAEATEPLSTKTAVKDLVPGNGQAKGWAVNALIERGHLRKVNNSFVAVAEPEVQAAE
ncbi:AAA family ATPase [Nocardioides zeae]|uniref:AAA family ATPase n=1 Tax=Nocardioides imazamoxiresistens TaxID=3231893 RepID=A0ABU3PR04_9ACTN|nr:AAA family ATPase [Nocardioides zeae]MDT9591611.1 AAA family ATPase [Nocardioides zeae]